MFVDIIISKKEEYHIRYRQLTANKIYLVTWPPKNFQYIHRVSGKERIPKSCVRYLKLTTHKTPCCLPHRYEPDQTCILPTRKEDTSTGGVHKFGVLSSNIRLLLNRTPLGKPNQEISWKKEGSYAVEETDTRRKHFDTTLICKLSTPSPDKFACCARHGLEEVRIEEDSRRQGKGGTRGGKSLDTGLGPESSFAVHKAVQRDSLSHFNFPRMNIEVSVTRRIWN